MAEQPEEENSVASADVHICIFPHLEEFLVIDVRDQAQPSVRVVSTGDFATPGYISEIEEDFAKLIRAEGPPFMNLMLLPARLQALLQQRGLARLMGLFGSSEDDPDRPRMSLFLAAGPVLNMDESDLAAAMDGFFDDKLASSFVAQCTAEFKRLLVEEKAQISKKERDELRRAVLGESDQFMTLWQDQPGEGFSSS